eukprot:g8800.t1
MTCSGTDAFRVDAHWDYNDGDVLSGCFEDSGQLAIDSELPVFTMGGVKKVGQPAIYAHNSSSAGHHVWNFGVRTDDASLIVWYCTDAISEDAFVLGHPANVRQWDCWDADDQGQANEHSVTTSCGCKGVPPSPAASLTPAPEPDIGLTSLSYVSSDEGVASCTSTDSFRIDAVIDYADEDNLHGCYQSSGQVVTSNLLPIFTVRGEDEREQPAVFAYNPSSVGHDVWTIGLWDSSGSLIGGYCIDAYSEDAHVLGHPTNVLRWDCWDEDDQAHTNVEFVVSTCGCDGSTFRTRPATPAPEASRAPSTLAPETRVAPAQEGSRDVVLQAMPLKPSQGALETLEPSPSSALGTLESSPSYDIPSYESTASQTASPMGVLVGGVATGLFVAGALVTAFVSKTRPRRMSNACIQSRDPEKSL